MASQDRTPITLGPVEHCESDDRLAQNPRCGFSTPSPIPCNPLHGPGRSPLAGASQDRLGAQSHSQLREHDAEDAAAVIYLSWYGLVRDGSCQDDSCYGIVATAGSCTFPLRIIGSACSFLVARTALMQSRLDSDSGFLEKLSAAADTCHSPAKALIALGLRHHPSTNYVSGYRDPLHQKIVYHADPMTLYRVAPQWSDLSPPQPPAGPAGQAALPDDRSNCSAAAPNQPLPPPPPASNAPNSSQLAPRAAEDEAASSMLATMAGAGSGEAPQYAGQMEDIMKAYIVRAVAALVEEADSTTDSKAPPIFSLHMPEASVHALCLASSSSPSNSPGQELQVADLCACKSYVFFELIRKRVGDVVTPLKQGFKKNDWAVGVLRAEKIDARAKAVHVSSSPVRMASCLPSSSECEAANVVLRLEALPIAVLLSLHAWEVSPDMRLDLALPTSSLNPSEAAKQSLMSDLLADGFFYLHGGDDHFDFKSSALQALCDNNFAERDSDGGYRLNEAGKRQIHVTSVISKARKIISVRTDVPVENLEVVELLLLLHKQGWRHETVRRSELPIEKYVRGESKVWFHEQGKDSLCKDYLVLLLTAQERELDVPHLKASYVYKALLAGDHAAAQARPAAGTRRGLVFMADDDLFIDEGLLKQQRKKRRITAHASRDAPLALMLDDFGPAESGEHVGDPALENQVGHDSDAELLQLAEEQARAEHAAERNISADSSSSSSSSSSGSSSDSGGSGSHSSSSTSSSSSSGSRGSAAPKPSAKPKARGRHSRNTQVSEAWGACRLTPTRTGYQMTCNHPAHQGETAACTKTRSTALSDDATTLRQLKTWALWGRTASSKEQHQKATWKRVLKAWKDGTLPSMEELDANPVQDYPEA